MSSSSKVLTSSLFGLWLGLGARPAAADLQPPTKSAPQATDSKLTTDSVVADIGGDHDKALQLADQAIKADPNEPWGYYARGNAFASLKKIDEAVGAFHDAERRSPDTDPWGKSVAIWGQANVLAQAGRCQEAAPAYERYAIFVEKLDPGAAAQARKFAKLCVAHGPAAAGATAPGAGATPPPATP